MTAEEAAKFLAVLGLDAYVAHPREVETAARDLAAIVTARERAARVEALRGAAADPALLEIGRKRIEDELIEWRDARLSTMMRGNGFVVCESDGKPSSIVRFGPEVGLRIGMQAMAEHLAARAEEEDRG